MLFGTYKDGEAIKIKLRECLTQKPSSVVVDTYWSTEGDGNSKWTHKSFQNYQ